MKRKKPPAPRSPHDQYMRLVFSILLVVREFLQEFLPAEQVKLLDLSTLQLASESYVSDDLKDSASDVVYTC